MLLLLVIFAVCLLSLCKYIKASLTVDKTSVFIVVLGDVARSPRMNYHSLSLVKLGYQVSIIGYAESKQLREIETNQKIKVIPLREFPNHLKVGPQVLQYAMKALYLSLGLLFTLARQKKSPRFILVQNPPSVPTLAIVYFFTKLARSKFVIDWHNYGFTILSLNKSDNNILVKICKKFEIFFGQKSDLNFCVTEAMKSDLQAEYSIKAVTIHDKAHERFKQLSLDEKQDFYVKLEKDYGLEYLNDSKGLSVLTDLKDGAVVMKKNRPVILVSSSSWTEDEDFHLLVDALDIYQKKIDEGHKLPAIFCILTGKGPLKEYYMKIFEERNYKNIRVNFLWLEPSDYPTLLGASDLGICFHKSSSNLDLPMKVVDMFGTRLPVCAYEFPCISELVKENENGLLFSNGSELAEHFLSLLSDLSEYSRLATFRQNLQGFSSWNQEWDKIIKPILQNI